MPGTPQEEFCKSTWDRLKEKIAEWKGERIEDVREEVRMLQTDWIAENSDAREEGIFRGEYEDRIKAAQEAQLADELNPAKVLELAEAYAILEPKDPRVLQLCGKLCSYGELFSDKSRQGDLYKLYGRSLFLANRYEETLEVMLKCHKCFQENGNRRVRRGCNVALLRCYAALGRSKECAERLEVALTQCEETDDSVLLYMHAKNALEKTGVPRDAEILDDIWYVFLDMNPKEKTQWENYQSMGDNVVRQCTNDDDNNKNVTEMISMVWPMMKRDLMQSTVFKIICMIFLAVLCMYVMLVSSMKLAGK